MLLPAATFRYDLTAAEIASLTAALVEQLQLASADVLSVHEAQRTFVNTLESWHELHGAVATTQCQVTLPAMVSADKDRRAAASAAKELLKATWDAEYSRPDLYAAFLGVSHAPQRTCSVLQRRLADHTLRRFRRMGADLPDTTREAYQALRRKISALEFQFQQALNEDVTAVPFAPEALAGCSDAFLGGLARQDGQLIVQLKPPHVLEVMQNARDPATRRRLLEARDGRCREENMARLLEVLHARQEAAELVGFPSHAAFQLSINMAKTPEAAEQLLRSVLAGLHASAEAEAARLRALRAKEMPETPASAPLELWDLPYYTRTMRDVDGGVNDAQVQAYFPLDHVRDIIFRMYEALLHVKIVPMEPMPASWQNSVQCFAVFDLSPTEADNLPTRPTLATRTRGTDEMLLGYFYLDLFPRDGKYSHQCVVPVCPTYRQLTGLRLPSVAANIGNLPRPGADGRPALLHHSQVLTFFHEFGHVMHCMCTHSDYSLFSWAWSVVPYPAGVENDFLEVPSQALENWVWDPAVLTLLSRHHETGEPMPAELVNRLAGSRRIGESLRYRRQIFLSLLDLELHSPAVKELRTVADLEDLYRRRHREIVGIDAVPGTAPLASFYHICQGYDAGYYGYLWSEVYSCDVFASFAESPKGCMDTALGLRYRRYILEPGATRDGMGMLRGFLGREPTSDAFLRMVGGTATAM